MVVVSIGHFGYLTRCLYCVVSIIDWERTQHNEHRHSNIPNSTPNHKENHAVKLDKKSIEITLLFIICSLIGIEVSLSPNPYTTHLIITLTIYICLKHDLPSKVERTILSWFDWREKWVEMKWVEIGNTINYKRR